MPGLQKAIAQLMEGRQERPREPTDPPALAQLLATVRARVAPDDRAHAEAFTRELFGKGLVMLADSRDTSALGDMAAAAYGFVRERGATPIAVRVFTPQRERDGWSSPLTVVESVLDDRPFIVETLTETIESAGGEIRLLLHPQLGVERAADGTIIRLGGPDDAAARESFFHAEVANVPATPALQQQIAQRLRQVVRVTGDYAAMRDRVATLARDLHTRPLPEPWDGERTELAAFLDWLANKSFVFLGYREYDLRGDAGARSAVVRAESGLGLLRDEARSHYHSPRVLPAAIARQIDLPPPWIVSTTHAVSPVHRAAPMDDIAVKGVDASGTVVRIHRILGLFTAKAYADAASELPILRRRLAAVLAREGAVPESHDYRDLVGLFNSLPRQQLLAGDAADVQELMDAIRAADPRGGIELVYQPDRLARGAYATVLVPRARFSTELHGSVSAALRRAFRADVLAEHLALDDRPIARLHYACVAPADILAQPPLDALRTELNGLLRTWDDELRDMLAETHARTDAERLASRYARVLPPAYKASTPVAAAARDLAALEGLAGSGRAQIELPPADPSGAPQVLKIYVANEALVLSDFIPVLENLGLRALGEHVDELRLPEVGAAAIHTFSVEAATGGPVAPAGRALVDALHALRAGAVENDRLNTLVLTAGLDWRAVDLLRALVAHARQAALGSEPTLVEALTANPESAARLFRYFAAKFDPSASALAAAERAAGPVAAAHAELIAGLDAVENLTHDRILRALGDTVAATVRTNFYAVPENGATAIKLAAAQLAHLPAPRPEVETWVHGPRMNGIHLRAARIARGGIRASDRPDDFRGEILGLMRTQVVKNAVIVPGGAKGGFIVKRAPNGPAPRPDGVAAAYRQFITALLSITDNLENGEPAPPPGLLIYDAADPYLVVAADKGTAGFSDVANAVAAERGWWLGDAFASGGRHGYDHKRLGITARGAWECARAHFREMGRDLDHATVTVVGIGDMSGDVFGNGLLRSRHLRLLAAFNHRELFIDPDPDPEHSYRERERLFHLPGSSWSDYAVQSFSRGGGVYARAAKTIPLSAEARALLGLGAAGPSGEDVVRAMLRLPVDLIWNGGIGTYVKASDEHHADVGDPGNDPVRIDARELRAAVVVEGGNLGLTQRARVEYAIRGGRINSDAIDNSAGVDLSDHEVNLKIALQPAVAAGELAVDARNALLAEVADAVCDAVLAHNRSQAGALTLDQLRSRTQLAPFRDLISILEAEAGLDRQLEHLPSREALRARRSLYLGLTRPELAVLMAHTKLDLRRRLVGAPLTDEPELQRYLHAYFPADVAERFAASVSRHLLRREIVALGVTNELVDSLGMTFLVRAVRDTGRDVLDVVRAWVAAREITEAAALYAEVGSRHPATAQPEHRGRLELASGIERATLWLVRGQAPGRPLGETIARFHEPVATLLSVWAELLPSERAAAHHAAIEQLAADGLELGLATRLARIGAAEEALEIAHIAHVSGAPLSNTAEAYFGSVALVDLDWLRRSLPSTLPGEDRWEPRAVASLLEVVLEMRRLLTQQILAQRRGQGSIQDCLTRYGDAAHDQLGVVTGLINDQKGAAQPTLAALLVVLREIGRLVRPPDPGQPW